MPVAPYRTSTGPLEVTKKGMKLYEQTKLQEAPDDRATSWCTAAWYRS